MIILYNSSTNIIYFSFQKDDITICFTLYGIFRCLELSLLKNLFVCLLFETFETFWKREGEFEFEFGIEIQFVLTLN